MKNTLRLITLVVTLVAVFTVGFAPFIPVTGTSTPHTTETNHVQPATTKSTTATTVDAAGIFSLIVVQQPKSKAGYVSEEPEKLTQFSMATKYGSQGFLAHNYLAGAYFSSLTVGSQITVTYADGSKQTFQVQEIRSFQATSPTSATSSFIDLATNKKLTATQLFMQTYGVKGNLILQTCIAKDNQSSWGRLFVIASPVLGNAN